MASELSQRQPGINHSNLEKENVRHFINSKYAH